MDASERRNLIFLLLALLLVIVIIFIAKRFNRKECLNNKLIFVCSLLFCKKPFVLGVENNVESIKSSIQANEDQTTSVLDTAIAKRLIITARALDGTEEPKTELTEADIVDEATEDSTKNTDQVYDEDNEGDDDELVRTTETGLYTSTEMISTTTRQERD